MPRKIMYYHDWWEGVESAMIKINNKLVAGEKLTLQEKKIWNNNIHCIKLHFSVGHEYWKQVRFTPFKVD